jgi:hypothetical protein
MKKRGGGRKRGKGRGKRRGRENQVKTRGRKKKALNIQK